MFSLFKEKRKKKVNDFSYLGSNIQTTKNYIHFYPNWTKNIHHRTWHVLCTNFFKKPYFIQTISQINVQFWLVRACIWENNVNAYEYVYGPLKQISAIVKKRRLQLAGHVFWNKTSSVHMTISRTCQIEHLLIISSKTPVCEVWEYKACMQDT